MVAAAFARGLSGQPTGRGVYARQMIEAVLRRDPGLQLHLFAAEPVDIAGCTFHRARGRNPVSDAWRMLAGAGRELRQSGAQLLWCATHFMPSSLPQLPKVVTLLDAVWRDHPETVTRARRLAARFMERGLFRADRIVCISGFTRERLVAHWPELAPRAQVIPCAGNPALLAQPNAPLALRQLGIDGPFVLNVDTLEPRKNLDTLLRAMPELPELTLIHVGGIGWKAQPLLDRARSTPNVRLLGYLDLTTLATLYRGARVAVFPSIYEGFHMQLLDAAGLGCPLVLSDIPVHREVMADAAAYAPATDPNALAAQIRAVASSESARERLAVAARERAAQYDWDRSGDALLALFRQLI